MGDFPVKERHSPTVAVWRSELIVGNAGALRDYELFRTETQMPFFQFRDAVL
jgi:hypothetical protein